MTLSMLCWGSWANTLKLTRRSPFGPRLSAALYSERSFRFVGGGFSLTYGLYPVAPAHPGCAVALEGRSCLGLTGGLIWGVGTIANFVASYVPMIGPPTSFSMGEGNTVISALWCVFVWKEFCGATSRVRLYLALMFLCFLLGLTSIVLSPIILRRGGKSLFAAT